MTDSIKTTRQKTKWRDIPPRGKCLFAGLVIAFLGFGLHFGPSLGLGVAGALLALCAALDRPDGTAP